MQHSEHAAHGGHSDHGDDIRSHVKTYWMIGAALYVFTVITVAVNQVHLAIPFAITVALIVATIKGSMVASVFMHLNHEKKWIYGSLILTVIGFIVLMSVPLLTTLDTIGTPMVHEVSTGAAHPGAVER
jgi:cytochrome c oxidase subunit IV